MSPLKNYQKNPVSQWKLPIKIKWAFEKLPIKTKWANEKENNDDDCDHNPDKCKAWQLWQMFKLFQIFWIFGLNWDRAEYFPTLMFSFVWNNKCFSYIGGWRRGQ